LGVKSLTDFTLESKASVSFLVPSYRTTFPSESSTFKENTMTKVAITTNLNPTTEQALLGVDPTITFGTVGTAVFGTATARSILADPGLPTPSIRIASLVPYAVPYVVRFGDSPQLPSFGNYYWSEHFGDVPTRVVFAVANVKGVE
jgi:hypothetical protein